MLKMIICDDDKIFCSSFEDLVIEICRERNLKYEIFMFYETTKLKKFLEDNNDIDLIFLDIELKKTLGYELGSYIRNVLNLQKIDIVYISNNSSYAMALFKTRPIDFLIKPIKKEDLRNVLGRSDNDLVVKPVSIRGEKLMALLNHIPASLGGRLWHRLIPALILKSQLKAIYRNIEQ